MVLQKYLIQIPFNGVQTKIDSKVVPFSTYESIDSGVSVNYLGLLTDQDPISTDIPTL